jgi:NitT/TauT family transport system permease protein
MKRFLLSSTIFIFFWYLFAYYFGETILPYPNELFFLYLNDSNIFKNWFSTVSALLQSVILGFLIGIIFGVTCSKVKVFGEVFIPIIDFFRTIPPVALFPIIVLLVGISPSAIIVTGALPTFFIFVVSIFDYIKNTSQIRSFCAKQDGFDSFQRIIRVEIPAILPLLTTSLKLSLSFSLISIVVCEMFLGGTDGLGQVIYYCYLTTNLPSLYAAILLLGVTGIVVQKLIFNLEEKLKWNHR